MTLYNNNFLLFCFTEAIDEFPCGQDMFEMTHDGTSSCFHVRRDLHGDYDRCYAFCAKLQNHYNSVMFDANSRSKMWRISCKYNSASMVVFSFILLPVL